MKYLKLIRLPNLLIMALIQYMLRYSLLIPTYGKDQVLGDLEFALLVFSMLLIAAGAYVINDYFDIQVDVENHEEDVLVGRSIKRRVALMLHVLITGTGVFLGFYIAYKVHYLALGGILALVAYLLWEYSLRLKKKFFIGNLIVAILSALFVFSLAAFELFPKIDIASTPHLIILISVYAGFAFICSFMHEIIKDLKGIQGDEKYGIHTLPAVWGISKSKEFVKWLSILAALMVVAISVYEFKTHIWAVSYAITLLIAPLFLMNIWVYKAREPNDYENISKLNKFIILTGILSMLFFI